MQEPLRLGVVQRPAHSIYTDADALAKNGSEVAAAIRAAAGTADLLVFPELCLTGYIPLKGYDQRRKAQMWEAARAAFETVVPELLAATAAAGITAVIGTPEPAGPRHELYNSALVLDAGRIAGVGRKLHLPVEENHYFTPGTAPACIETRAGRLGAIICYDIVFPEAARLLALQGAELIVVPSNWIEDANLVRLGEVMPVARAMENEVPVVFCNGVGEVSVRQYTYQLFGRSRIVSATGEVLAQASAGAEVLTATLPAGDLLAGARVFPIFRDRRLELYGPLARPYPGAGAPGSGR